MSIFNGVTTFIVAASLICCSLSGCNASKEQPDFTAPVIYDFTARHTFARLVKPIKTIQPGDERHRTYLGANWGKPEMHHSGKKCAWAMDDEVEVFFLPGDLTDSRLTINCFPYTRSYLKQQLTILVNGKKLDTIDLEEGNGFKDYTFKVPGTALIKGLNTVRLSFRYNSSRNDIAACIQSITLENNIPVQAPTPETTTRLKDGLQAANTILSWKIVRPFKGYLRVQATFEQEKTGNVYRVYQRDQGQRQLLFEGATSLTAPLEIPLTGTRGKRQTFELEVVGDSGVRWQTCEIGGVIEPSDVNILLFSNDTLRPDHTGAYGYPKPTTPFMDSLAEDGALFLNAFAVSNDSAPSHASIMTGRYPQSHGLMRNGRTINPQQLTLADIFNKNGYETGAFVNFIIIGREDMVSKGFQVRTTRQGTPESLDITPTDKANVFSSALEWIADNREKKLFLFLHSQFTHMDHIPEPYASMFWDQDQSPEGAQHFFADLDKEQRRETYRAYTRMESELTDTQLDSILAVYDGSIRMTDDFLAEFKQGLGYYGLDPYFAIVFVSDHGMSIGEQHQIKHTGHPYNHLLHVPLVFDLPGSDQVKGTRIKDMVETIDIAPTLLDYTGIKIPRRIQGSSLLPLLRGEDIAEKEFVYALIGGKGGLDNYYSIRSKKWFYTANYGSYEFLADMESEKGSEVNVVEFNQQARDKLRKAGQDWLKNTPDVETDKEELSDDIKTILIKAGYLGRGR